MREAEIIAAIRSGNKPDLSSIGLDSDDDGSCDTCGGRVEWPPTGEPASAVCIDGCHERIHRALWEHNDSKGQKP